MQRLLTHVTLATMDDPSGGYGLIHDGALVVGQGRILWCGPLADLPPEHRHLEHRGFEGRVVTPGLIDCHTHIIHAGDRAHEFEMRLESASYEAIARAGGGIMSTVNATRAASADALLKSALRRADALIGEGITTLEIKSGYGLTIESELTMLRVARKIAELRPVRVKTSFLGAHAIPLEYKDRSNAYMGEVVLPALQCAHAEGLVDAVDGFCEGIAFSLSQIDWLFQHTMELGLPIKLHAEQLSNLGGAKLAAKYGALSADHLEFLDEDGVVAMANAGTVAVMLPGAFYTLRETQLPPIDLLRKHKVPMAVATDSNPGSSPMTSILTAMNMAATLFRMTPTECLAGTTRHAATALGLQDCGMIKIGMRADLAIWDIEHPRELSCRIGFNPLHQRIFGGAL